jgi:hypothetical protein
MLLQSLALTDAHSLDHAFERESSSELCIQETSHFPQQEKSYDPNRQNKQEEVIP